MSGLEHAQPAGAGCPQACAVAKYTHTHRKLFTVSEKVQDLSEETLSLLALTATQSVVSCNQERLRGTRTALN